MDRTSVAVLAIRVVVAARANIAAEGLLHGLFWLILPRKSNRRSDTAPSAAIIYAAMSIPPAARNVAATFPRTSGRNIRRHNQPPDFTAAVTVLAIRALVVGPDQ
jgi:hypothetical protein